jgi:hypothetical protein
MWQCVCPTAHAQNCELASSRQVHKNNIILDIMLFNYNGLLSQSMLGQ